jgi:HlyD family secretion protein
MYGRMNSALLAVFASIVSLGGCSKQAAEPEPVVTVETATVRTMALQQVVTSEAVLFPKNEVAITPKVMAPVREFYVNRGSRVRKGALLAVLENRDISATVTENRGVLEEAQARYDTTVRASLPEDLKKAEFDAKAAKEAFDAQQKLYESRQKLYQEGALPRKDLDQSAVALAQARAQNEVARQHLRAFDAVGKDATTRSAAGQLTSAQGRYRGAQAQLSYTEIRSPITGVVTDRPVWPGETAPAGAPLLTIMDTSSVVARAHVPQEQAALLKPGDPATIAAPNVPPVPAKVTVVSPALDPGSTTVQVWVEAENKSGRLRPGSTVQVRIVARTIENALTIPEQALLKTPEGGTRVMVLGDQGKAHETDVETGIHTGNIVQITKGLQHGETVITTGAYGLPDNTRVRVASGANSSGEAPTGTTD